MFDDPLFIQAFAFIVTAGVALFVIVYFSQNDRQVNRRLEDLDESLDTSTSKSNPGRKDRAVAEKVRAAVPRIGARLIPNNEEERTRLQSRLMQAGIYSPHALSVLMTVRVVGMILPPAIGLCLGLFEIYPLERAVAIGALVGGSTILFSNIWLSHRKAKRHHTLTRSLPDFLDLTSACLESGLSLDAALQRVTEELQLAHPILAAEMNVVQREIQFGGTPESALRHLADRSGLESIGVLSSLVQQARRYGTGIAKALAVHADMVRSQREQFAEEMAQKAAVKILFPTLLFILPAIFVVVAGPAAIQLGEVFGKPAQTKLK